jgi:hypothetical protein
MLGKIRTLNPQIRSLVLYPIELQTLQLQHILLEQMDSNHCMLTPKASALPLGDAPV